MPDDITYGIEPETGLAHAFTRHGEEWRSWCRHYLVMLWTRWKRMPTGTTPTCLYCAIHKPR